MQHEQSNKCHTPLARLASILAGIVLVLSLMPAQGLAEAYDEVVDLTVSETQENQTNDSGTTPTAGQEGQDEGAVTDGVDAGQPAQPSGDQGSAEGEEVGVPTVVEQGESASATSNDASSGATSQSTSKPVQSPSKPARQLSAKLSDFLADAVILNAKETDDVIVVNEGATYNVKLSFAEGIDNKEFAEKGELTFALPNGFVASGNQPAAKNALVASYVDGNGQRRYVELDKNCWWVRGNVIHLVWRARDAANRSKEDVAKGMKAFFALTNAEFDLVVAGKFAKRTNAIDFGAGEMNLDVVPAQKQVAKKIEQKKQPAPKANTSQAETESDETTEDEQDVSEVAQVPTTEFAYEDDQVYVTATTTKAGAIPDDASLEVTRVSGRPADLYLTALNATASHASEYDADNTLLYDVAFFVDGEEVQPTEGDVKVSFTFKQDQLSDEIGARERGFVEVNHLPMVNGAPSVEPVGARVSVEEGTADFATKSFSVYAFSYTVDFTYNDLFFSMPGEGSVTLSSLFVALGINSSVADVASVTFTNPELLSVTKELVGNDWRLVSLKPFDTTEKLSVEMANNDVYQISVKGPTKFYTDITVQKKWVGTDGVKDSEKGYGLRPDSVKIYPLKDGKKLSEDAHVWQKNAEGEYVDTEHNYITLSKDETSDTWPAVVVALPKSTTDGEDVKTVYTFEEEAVDYYEGTCEWDTTATDPSVTVTNTHQTGTLNVTKSLVADEQSKEYFKDDVKKAIADETTFTVEGPGFEKETKKLSEFSETKEGEYTWSVGSVKAGEYTITETGKSRDGWRITRTAKYTSGDAVLSTDPTTDESLVVKPAVEGSNPTTVSFTNTCTKTGSLKITKAVTVNGVATTGTEADGTYVFTVVGKDEGNKNEMRGVAITIANGQAKEEVVDDLLPGKYTVTEQTPANGTKLVGENGIELTVPADNTKAEWPSHTFTNNMVVSTDVTLSVTKQVLGEGYKGTEEFEFKLAKLSETATSDQLPSNTTVKVRAGKTGDFDAITYTEPGLYMYTITEVKPKSPTPGMTYDTTAKYAIVVVDDNLNAKVTYSPTIDTKSYTGLSATQLLEKFSQDLEKGTISTNDKLTVTNTYTGGKLYVYKLVVSTRSEDKSRSYSFKVAFDDKTISGTYGGMKFQNGVATFTLKGGESMKATGLPISSSGLSKYTVTETNSGGLTSSMGSPIKNASGTEQIVYCTNTYKAPSSTTTKSSTTSGSTLATTSDSTNIVAPIVLLAIGVAGVVGGVLYRRHKQQ